MNSVNKLLKLAARFESKLHKQAQDSPQVSQSGTTELFFGDEGKQRAFAAAIQDPNGPVYKVLAALFTKLQAPVSFDLKMMANPGQGAKWILTVQPPSALNTVKAALDHEFKTKVDPIGFTAREQAANNKAKAGAGSGPNTLDVGALDLS